MPESKVKNERNADVALLSGLTRRQLKELEEKEKTPAQKTAEAIIMILPLLCGCIAMAEYVILPNNSRKFKALELRLGAWRGHVHLSCVLHSVPHKAGAGRKAAL